MTEPRQANIDGLSCVSLLLEPSVNGLSLGRATGFAISHNERHYLVTNWHVLAGRNPDTGTPISPTGAVPDAVGITFHRSAQLGTWTARTVPVIDAEGKRLWMEHPAGREVDVVLLPLDPGPEVVVYPLDLALARDDVAAAPSMPVAIIGFPLGLTGAGVLPIWKTGHIASDPDIDYGGTPTFLIDATTRGGMSGSPVVLRFWGGYPRRDGSKTIGGSVTSFMGVYSGRIRDDVEVGKVWRPHLIAEILAGAGA